MPIEQTVLTKHYDRTVNGQAQAAYRHANASLTDNPRRASTRPACTPTPLLVTCHRSAGSLKVFIMNLGTEWLVDAEGCSADLLRDVEAVRGVCEEVVADLGLRVVGEPLWHQFPQPGGVTGLYLLTESHLACHTFPETGKATFNLFCCRPRPEFAWEARLQSMLKATRVTVRSAERGPEAMRGAESPNDVAAFETTNASSVSSVPEVSSR